jgi:hypothetical protein
MACVLSTFNIAKARDEKGAEIEIDRDAFTDTVIRQVQDSVHRRICAYLLRSMPHPFDCSITSRSSQAASLIHDTILALPSNP